MKQYLVEYRVPLSDHDEGCVDAVEFFRCMADNVEHAQEQALNAYPEATIITVYEERT